MTSALHPLAFRASDLAIVRLLRAHAFAVDLATTRSRHEEVLAHLIEVADSDEAAVEAEGSWAASVSAKEEFLIEVIQALQGWVDGVDLPPATRAHVEALVAGDPGSTEAALRGCMRTLADGALVPILLEAVTSTDWPKGLDWEVARNEALAQGVVALSPTLTEQAACGLLDDFASRHRRARRRLRRDSMAPGTQATYGAVVATLAITTHGASEAIGTFIGVHMFGLSGAAATSAGLAWLGGGSLAAGGFGMAGGTLLAGTAVMGAKNVTQKAAFALLLAKSDRAAFINELAKLDVRCELEPETGPSVYEGLRQLEASMRREWDELRPAQGVRRQRLMDVVSRALESEISVTDAYQEAKDVLPDCQERELAASVRALEYELRHLESAVWKRRVSAVPRFFGFPAAQKLIDQAEIYASDFAQGWRDGRASSGAEASSTD